MLRNENTSIVKNLVDNLQDRIELLNVETRLSNLDVATSPLFMPRVVDDADVVIEFHTCKNVLLKLALKQNGFWLRKWRVKDHYKISPPVTTDIPFFHYEYRSALCDILKEELEKSIGNKVKNIIAIKSY